MIDPDRRGSTLENGVLTGFTICTMMITVFHRKVTSVRMLTRVGRVRNGKAFTIIE